MLDSETRRRIDTARDILVGKVPDPKSQVEQITIALVYKFMDDMDKQSIEMGGKASFFKGKFAKYGWSNIFDPRLGGIEMLALYGEAITNMSQNENLPQLFRDIFKNAFLPYRDPETLKLFLKTINEFTYDHSEKLGDAFEYLLSVLGSQGDAGQFRTPRHIIDFMVQVLGPKKNETVLDPACGTAGFLISAYKYIINNNQDPKGFQKPLGSKPLTAQEKQAIYKNFTGYDISPDMVRLSLVNLYLHGFVTPQIHEYDTLTSEERWNDYFDVILANPPFMSPKGGIKPHKRFSVASNRSEVLFVDYMAEHLTPNGRAAIIVPEGIIFQSAGAYKQLRKYLIEHNYLWAVVSLPAGVFNPYAGVKTSILFLDRSLARKTQEILFVKVEADGFDLGAQRRPIDRNDLPDALNTLLEYQKTLRVSSPSDSLTAEKTLRVSDKRASSVDEKPASFSPTPDSQTLRVSTPTQDSNRKETLRVLTVSKSRLAENEDYNLSADRYREVTRAGSQKYSMVKMKDIFDIERGASPRPIDNFITADPDGVNWIKIGDGNATSMYITSTKEKITQEGAKKSRWVQKGDLILSNSMSFGHPYILDVDGCIHDGWLALRPKDNSVIKEFIYHILGSEQIIEQFTRLATGGVVNNLNSNLVRNVEIPLPPLETQRQIVDEIAAHQRIIDGARQVVDGWKPDIEIEFDENWEVAKLDDLCEIVRGSSPRPRSNPKFYGGNIPRLMVADVTRDGMYVTPQIDTLTEEGARQSRPMKKGDLVMAVSGQPGLCGILTIDACIHDGFAGFRNLNNEKILTEFAYHYLMSQREANDSQSVGAIFKNLNTDQLRRLEIPLPPLSVQREIIARIERERAIIESNRELIRLYEEKVKKVIERVWEE